MTLMFANTCLLQNWSTTNTMVASFVVIQTGLCCKCILKRMSGLSEPYNLIAS